MTDRGAMDETEQRRRYNFDRYRGHHLMAEGIAVHATSQSEAEEKATRMLRDDDVDRELGATIRFRDNKRCVSRCGICDVTPGAQRGAVTPRLSDSRPPRNVAEWKALIAAIGTLRRGKYPGGPGETCVCYHPHGECVTCGCALLARAPLTDQEKGRKTCN